MSHIREILNDSDVQKLLARTANYIWYDEDSYNVGAVHAVRNICSMYDVTGYILPGRQIAIADRRDNEGILFSRGWTQHDQASAYMQCGQGCINVIPIETIRQIVDRARQEAAIQPQAEGKSLLH